MMLFTGQNHDDQGEVIFLYCPWCKHTQTEVKGVVIPDIKCKHCGLGSRFSMNVGKSTTWEVPQENSPKQGLLLVKDD